LFGDIIGMFFSLIIMNHVFRCVIDFPAIIFTIPQEIVFTYYAFLLGFLFPVSMITTFYILVLVRLNNIRRKHQSEMKQRSHRKVTRIVLAVITAYFICWVPYWFLQIFITIDPLIHSLRWNFSILPANTNMRFLKELTHLTTIIGYANNCLNPVLYVFLSESFREEYLIVLKCFHPGGLFMEQALNNGQNSFEREYNQRQSTQLIKRRELAIKKAKHSIAIDEIPSNYRSFSLCFPRANDHTRYSTTSIQNNERDRNSIDHSAISRLSTMSRKRSSIKYSCDQQKHMLMVALSIAPTHSPLAIIDDGGVYCGD
jgi:hypothetical protein